jgi:hypothetical protein
VPIVAIAGAPIKSTTQAGICPVPNSSWRILRSICRGNGRRALTFTTDSLKVWDVPSGRLIRSLPGIQVRDDDGQAPARLAVSADGNAAVAYSGYEPNMLRFYDLAGEAMIDLVAPTNDFIIAFRFHRDGRELAIATNKQIYFVSWKVEFERGGRQVIFANRRRAWSVPRRRAIGHAGWAKMRVREIPWCCRRIFSG